MNEKIYTCPMHPDVRQNKPGICPICGMNLEPVLGGESEEDKEYRDMLRRFIIGTILTLPVFILAMLNVSSPLFHWIQFILTTPVVLWAGWPFFKRAWYSLINRSLNMFSLIAMGVGCAYLYSFAALFAKQEMYVYFEAASVITVLVLLGQVLELKAKSQTGHAIRALLEKGATTAHLIENGKERDVPIEEVKVSAILRVKPGEKIPVDGVVLEGSSLVDESLVTGESVPVPKKEHDKVVGSSLNEEGSFLMKAEKVGSETLLAKIVQMVSNAQRSKAPIQNLADQVSAYFVPFVIFVALLTFIIWWIWGPQPSFSFAIINAVAVLIIACPCALGLATPMSIMVGVGKGAEFGVLIKNGEALERLEKVDTIVIDKTGTLTEGKPKVVQILPVGNWTEENVLKYAGALEKNSEHPFAKAIVQEAEKRNINLPNAQDFKSKTGEGVSGNVENQIVLVGQPSYIEHLHVEQYQALVELSKQNQEKAFTTVFVAVGGKAVGVIALADPIKETTPHAIEELHRMGIKVVMLTGDNRNTAKAVASKLPIDEFYAEVNPEKKIVFVQKLQQEKKSVAMAGDGINDAPALAAADVGIAMGTGTDVAMESAGVTLVRGDLIGIVNAIKLSRATMRNIRENLFFAFIYNILGIPIAAGVLFPLFKILLNPMIASAAMSMSSVSVIFNSLRLKRIK